MEIFPLNENRSNVILYIMVYPHLFLTKKTSFKIQTFPVSPTIIAPHPASSPEPFHGFEPESNHLQLQRLQNAQNWPPQNRQQNFVTKTVSGFMDFVTTVGNTVIVFTPAGLGGGYSEQNQFTRTRNPTGSL